MTLLHMLILWTDPDPGVTSTVHTGPRQQKEVWKHRTPFFLLHKGEDASLPGSGG